MAGELTMGTQQVVQLPELADIKKALLFAAVTFFGRMRPTLTGPNSTATSANVLCTSCI